MIDNNFKKYIWYKDLIDIKTVLKILKGIDLDVDSDILEAIADVVKTATDEFLVDARKYNMPQSMYKDVLIFRDNLLERINNELKKEKNRNRDKQSYIKSLRKQSIDSLIKMNEDLYKNMDNIDNFFKTDYIEDLILEKKYYFLYKKDIKKELKLTEGELNYWLSYYKRWIKESKENLDLKKSNLDKKLQQSSSNNPINYYDEIAVLEELISNKEYSKNENEIKEEIKRLILNEEKFFFASELASNFINNHITDDVSDEDLKYWFDYCKKWLDSDIYSYNDKRKELRIDDEGIFEHREDIEETDEFTLECHIFLVTLYLKNNNLKDNYDLLRKIIKYELLNSKKANQINISNEKVDYYYNYYTTLVNSTKSDFTKERIKMFFIKRKIKKTMEDYEKIPIFYLAAGERNREKDLIQTIKNKIVSGRKFIILTKVEKEYKNQKGNL